MDASPPPPPTLRQFQIQNGLVISESGQQDADDFAADFQGLRHFSDRVGTALALGGSLYATLHEPGFSFIFILPEGGSGQPNRATGAMITYNISNAEMLKAVTAGNE